MTSTDTALTDPGHAPTRRRSARPRVGTVLLVAVTVLLAGCGLRWEEPEPAPLVPGPVEQARQHATADAVALRVLTGQVATQVTDPVTLEILARIEASTDEHLSALGGLYEPATPQTPSGPRPQGEQPSDDGPEDPTMSPTAVIDDVVDEPEASTPAPPAVTPADLTALLEQTGTTARQDADDVPDGPLARLLASVGTARLLLAHELGAALAGAEDGTVPPGPTVDASDPLVPHAVPEGLVDRDVQVLVQSEDALGLAWEVAAARGSDAGRTQAALRAEQHRERAEQWARAGGISGTEQDPRRSAYELPAELTSPDADPTAFTAALAPLERALGAAYASLVASAAPGSRTALIAALVEVSGTVTSLTGAVETFPGLPEPAVVGSSPPTETPEA